MGSVRPAHPTDQPSNKMQQCIGKQSRSHIDIDHSSTAMLAVWTQTDRLSMRKYAQTKTLYL